MSGKNFSVSGLGLRYVLVGLLAFSTDIFFYVVGLSFGLQNFQAKAISFILGMNLSFFLNRAFTFRTRETQFGKVKFVSLYTFSLLVNVSINSILVMKLTQNSQFSKVLAFFAASATAIVINFVGMRYIVFKMEKRVDFD